MGVKEALLRANKTLSKHSPTILTSLGVAGVLTTAVMAAKATPKALRLLDDYMYEKDPVYRHEDLTAGEVIRVAWKVYIPTMAVGLVTCTCIIAANHVNLRRNAALAGLYTLTETAFKEYQTKVAQTIGHNKERKVHDAVNADRVANNPPSVNDIIITGDGEVLCYDALSGRYFKSDIETVRRKINDLSFNMLSGDFVSLNDLYYELGLQGTKLGDQLGWGIDLGKIDPKFSSTLTEDGKPCLVIDFEIYPKYFDFN